jgi:hypothetical protein
MEPAPLIAEPRLRIMPALGCARHSSIVDLSKKIVVPAGKFRCFSERRV